MSHETSHRPPAGGQDIIHHVPRRVKRGRPRPRLSLNATAMIDVVFLLLVYFLVATNFRMGEEVYRLDLPERGAAVEADPFQLDESPLRVRVISTGEQRGTYRLSLEEPFPTPASFDDLFHFLQQRQRTPGSGTGLFTPDHPIIIDPSPQTRWEHAMGAFNAAARARYTNITFSEGGSG